MTHIPSGPNAGRFLGLFSFPNIAAFVFGGVEQVAVVAGEARNPTRSIPDAIDLVSWRILFFYVFVAFAIGPIVRLTYLYALAQHNQALKSASVATNREPISVRTDGRHHRVLDIHDRVWR